MLKISEHLNQHPNVKKVALAGSVGAIGVVAVLGIDAGIKMAANGAVDVVRIVLDDVRGGLVNCAVVTPQSGGSVMSPNQTLSCTPGGEQPGAEEPLVQSVFPLLISEIGGLDFSGMDVFQSSNNGNA